MAEAKQKQHDPEETREEQAARRIDAASEQHRQRCVKFETTLRANARHLTPYKRQILAAWLKRLNQRLLDVVEDGDEIPPLGIDSLPDYE